MPPGNVRDDEVKEGLCTFEVYDNGRLNMRFIVLHQQISAIGTDRFVSAWMLYR